jgi:MFS family permease
LTEEVGKAALPNWAHCTDRPPPSGKGMDFLRMVAFQVGERGSVHNDEPAETASLPPTRSTQPPRTALIATALFVAWLVAYMDRVVIGTAIVPMSADLHLGAADKGAVLGIFYVSYALMQLGGGWLTDRFGARWTLIGCLGIWSVFTILTGLAWSFLSLVFVRFLFGLGEGAFSPASASAISSFFPKNVRGRVQALMGSTAFVGGALGGAVTAWAVVALGWRQSFFVLGIMGLAVLAGFLVTIPAKEQSVVAEANANPTMCFRDVAKANGVWQTTLLWFCVSITSLGLQSWLPSYLVAVRHIDIVHVGLYGIVPGAAGFLAINGIGRVLDVGRPSIVGQIALAGAALLPLSLAAILFAPSTPLLIFAWSLFMLGFGCLYATVLSVPVKSIPTHTAGRAMGIINFGGQLAGAIAAWMIGKLVEAAHGGFGPAFGFLIAAGVAVNFAAILVVRSGLLRKMSGSVSAR